MTDTRAAKLTRCARFATLGKLLFPFSFPHHMSVEFQVLPTDAQTLLLDAMERAHNIDQMGG